MEQEIEVTVTLKITVNREAWAAEFGTESTVKAVREDVKSYFGNETQGHYLRDSGIITDATWR